MQSFGLGNNDANPQTWVGEVVRKSVRQKAKRARRSLISKSLFLLCIMGALALMLAVLGIMEYQWSGTVREANRERMQSNLHAAFTGMHDELDRELVSILESLQPETLNTSLADRRRYARQFELWRQHARYSNLVSSVYAFTSSPGASFLLRWERSTRRFAPVPDSPRMQPIMDCLKYGSGVCPNRNMLQAQPIVWTLTTETPVLIEPVFQSPVGVSSAYLLVELRLDVLRRLVFPELIRRFLGSDGTAEYRIAVLSKQHPETLIYQSEPGLTSGSFAFFDDKLALLGGQSNGSSSGGSATKGPDSWEMVAKHRQGPLTAAVEGVRLKSLMINFGVLLVLALGMATIVIYVLRAQKFLRLQMEFVANVSHELRTPLSIIGSAADNLAEGIVRSDQGVREYGSLIRSECRRLSALVEQTLRFAAGRADYRARNVQFLRIAEIVEAALADVAAVIDASGATVEKNIDSDLPMIRADSRMLSECLLNLLSNALKYGGEKRWVGVRAIPVETGRGTGVQITVQDRGIGIPSEELNHIFEPFYRGRAAFSAQIRGTGLGLSLAQEAASAMNARITVESAPGEGSAFTIHLPAAYMNSSTIPLEAIVES